MASRSTSRPASSSRARPQRLRQDHAAQHPRAARPALIRQLTLRGQDTELLDDCQRTGLRREQIGFVFQTFNLLPTLSAVENVAFQLRLLGWPTRAARHRATETLERVGLGHRLRHRPGELSGGEQQRTAIARAIAKSPALLLADEPTGTLDSQNGEAILDLLRQLNQAGQTILLVTHNPDLARNATRLLTLRDGRLSEQPRRRQADRYASWRRRRWPRSMPGVDALRLTVNES